MSRDLTGSIPAGPIAVYSAALYLSTPTAGTGVILKWLMEGFRDRVFGSSAMRLAIGFALAAAVIALSGWLVTGPGRSYVGGFDGSIRSVVRQMPSPLWTSLFLAVTKLGSTIYLAIIGSAVGIVFIGLRWLRPLGLFVIAMIGQAALHNGAKWYFARPRPAALISYPAVESFSFPSGHALSAFCLYATAAWLITNRLENPAVKAATWASAILLISLIGLSRVYIGVHYPSDVLAGWLTAAVWTAAVASADKKQF